MFGKCYVYKSYEIGSGWMLKGNLKIQIEHPSTYDNYTDFNFERTFLLKENNSMQKKQLNT